MALSESTTREREDPLGSFLMSKYKELKLEYDNLRRENRQLSARLEASERRIDALSRRFLEQMGELENKMHAETSEQVRSLGNVYEIRFQILEGRLRDYMDRDTEVAEANIQRNTQEIRRVSLRQQTVKFREELKDFWTAVRPSRGQAAFIIFNEDIRSTIFVTLKIGELECKTIFLIIPKLTKNCVLGIDVLRTMGSLVNLRDGTLTLHQESKTATIKMYGGELTEAPRTNQDEVRLLDSYEELTTEQLQAKIESRGTMPQAIKRKYKDLLWKYREIFITKPGRIDCYYHRLTLTDGHPPCPRTYLIPYNYEKEADEQIQAIMRWDIIQKFTSPFVNPLVATTTKDGKIRLCLDARKLNKRL